MHRRAGEGTVLARAVLAPRATGVVGGVAIVLAGGGAQGLWLLGLVMTHARWRLLSGEPRMTHARWRLLSGGLSAMPQVVALGCFVGEAVFGSLAMEWGADGEVLEVDGHWGRGKAGRDGCRPPPGARVFGGAAERGLLSEDSAGGARRLSAAAGRPVVIGGSAGADFRGCARSGRSCRLAIGGADGGTWSTADLGVVAPLPVGEQWPLAGRGSMARW